MLDLRVETEALNSSKDRLNLRLGQGSLDLQSDFELELLADLQALFNSLRTKVSMVADFGDLDVDMANEAMGGRSAKFDKIQSKISLELEKGRASSKITGRLAGVQAPPLQRPATISLDAQIEHDGPLGSLGAEGQLIGVLDVAGFDFLFHNWTASLTMDGKLACWRI